MRPFFLLCLIIFSNAVLAAPKPDLWPYWQTSDEHNSANVSHQMWQNLLDRYLIQDGENTLFNYADVTSQDKVQLNTYLSQLAKIDPRTYQRQEQYAYWVNLYNALTVRLILDNYPISSITKLGGLFSFGPWDEKIFNVSGQNISLNDIEHRILRPIWNEPRTHYALNCASLGCPNLQRQAFTAQNTEQLLDEAARVFVNSDKGARVDDQTLILSSIYEWFAVDFGGSEHLLKHLAQYRPELTEHAGKVDYQYDWALNGVQKKK